MVRGETHKYLSRYCTIGLFIFRQKHESCYYQQENETNCISLRRALCNNNGTC